MAIGRNHKNGKVGHAGAARLKPRDSQRQKTLKPRGDFPQIASAARVAKLDVSPVPPDLPDGKAR
jgi:hypothetical protein